MTAATLTEHRSTMPGIKVGAFSAQNGSTTKFGLASVIGAVLTMDDNDDVIVSVSISSGEATIAMIDDAGAGVATASTGFYLAWGDL